MTSPGTMFVMVSSHAPSAFEVSASVPELTVPPFSDSVSLQKASEPAPPRRSASHAAAAMPPLTKLFISGSFRVRSD
tara:strand:+ start:5007 stop:5237 length:231 start_codon:yes stop_codon:yes gene_type:complete